MSVRRHQELPVQTAPAHILHVFSSFGIGGLETRMAEILNHLGPAYRHSLLALDGNIASQRRLSKELKVEILTECPSHRNPLSQVAIARGLLRSLRPALLATYNWGAVDWALANRLWPVCPHIHLEGGFGPEEARRQLLRRILYRRLALARSIQVVVPSRCLRELALKTWRLKPEQVRHIPNGVDCAKFGAASTLASVGRSRNGYARSIIIGTVAALRPEKNLALLIRAFAQLAQRHDIRLVIVGDGPELERLKCLADRLWISDITTFTGHSESVDCSLAGFDIFALTSDTEQMPSSVLQAMASARAVAAFAVGDLSHMLAPPNRRLLAAPGDEQGLIDVLERLISDAALRRQLGAANRDFAKANFAWSSMLAEYEKVFRQAVTAEVDDCSLAGSA